MKQTQIIKRPAREDKKKRQRNPYLQLLTDEELDVLELLAKKAIKERDGTN